MLGVDEGEFFSRGGKTVFSPRVDTRAGLVYATVGAVEKPARGEAPLLVLRVRPRSADANATPRLVSGFGLDIAGRQVVLEFTGAPVPGAKQ
jgi:hypothetical protein